jgi:DNA-binding IclR family transcriptional regulator
MTRSVVAQIVIRLDTSLDPARTNTTLRELAAAAGVDLPTAHRSLSVLFDQKLLYLAEDDLVAPDVAALEALLD